MQRYRYVIVGAGPAGLQMGYFLEQARREYVILEARSIAGSFFTEQPRHRTLISFNKCHNWFEEPEFNLRYDWNSLLTYDSSLRFPEYTEELYPSADVFVEYLNDFAAKFALNIQYETRVASIFQNAGGGFVLTDGQGRIYECQCLLMATGAVAPSVPEEIEGIDLAEGYETHRIDPERFTNQRVMILGRGNSAFEIADHLASHAATIHIYTAGKLIRHAWQTHYVGDLRAVNNSMLEMNQIKLPHLVSGAKVTKILRRPDGALQVSYEEDVPHWAVPGTMRGQSVYDHVIRATGWKYFEPSLFSPDARPASDAKSKFPALNSMWESSVPGLFYIGAAMAGKISKAPAGFVHGFRHNIRSLFHLLEQRYDSMPLPARSFPLRTEEDLEILVQAVLTRISTTSALFQMFGVLGDAVVFTPGRVDWYPELPMSHALAQSQFAGQDALLAITLELGFDRFPTDTDALSFIHPNDPGGDGCCVAFIHPVLRHFSGGKVLDEVHMASGVFVRYDGPNEDFAGEFDRQIPHHRIFNLINRIARVTSETLPVGAFNGAGPGGFSPWPPGRPAGEAAELPQCTQTHRPDFVPDLAKYQ